MRYLLTALVLLQLVAPSFTLAKRIPQAAVDPVVFEGVKYVAPNEVGFRAYVQARHPKTDELIWQVTVFSTVRNPFLEEDVQWVLIKRLYMDSGKLIVIDECNRAYSIDLKTRYVRKLKPISPEEPSNR